MTLKYLLIASAVLIALCGADVSEIKAAKVDLPFNDLLPPLLDESTTTTTTTTTTVRPTTTLATKPTKKPYYQKPALLAKEDKPKSIAGKPEVQQLHLDLLPPFEDEVKPAEEQPQTVVKTTPKPVVKVPQPPVVRVTSPAVPKVTAPRPQNSVQAASAPRPQYSVQPAPQVVLPTHAPALGSGFQSRFSNYFLTSTVRPRRGPLPTITPFPRFVRL
ncbi:uncharacterized protein LOC108027085 [Drosophila biarmipes]|uniref:uncharacterized protein LOC108027085 n=1 Tax=Drosophila biarmipes TaxID=125945 RepID=UPI0007E62394|nr:uncharacterized protein LOC108027085 [Drosophila biarmipes]